MADRKIELTSEATAELQRIVNKDPLLAKRALAIISLLARGRFRGQPLLRSPKYGDLSDHRKAYLGVAGQKATHRIVYHETSTKVHIVAIGPRRAGTVYLEAAERLKRLPQESRPALDQARRQTHRGYGGSPERG